MKNSNTSDSGMDSAALDDDAMREPGDYCEGCDDYVASDGACYCPDPEEDES